MNPFSSNTGLTLASIGEKRLLHTIREWLDETAPASPWGMGDDCAVLPASGKTAIVTTDSVVYGRHFDDTAGPAQVGEKLLKRNLSDIAAMGGTPRFALVAGFLPRTTRLDWLQGFHEGLAACARGNRVKVVGGDLAESNADLCLNLTLYGNADRPLLRSGGRIGDRICCTGPLGGSRLGRHLNFLPRLREGRLLARCNAVHAAIDISDGLLIDLLNLLPADTSAALETESIPVHTDALRLAGSSGKEPLWHALNDGEDHELLFLMDADEAAWDSLLRAFADNGLNPPLRIGQLIPKRDAPIIGKPDGAPLPSHAGYDHFG